MACAVIFHISLSPWHSACCYYIYYLLDALCNISCSHGLGLMDSLESYKGQSADSEHPPCLYPLIAHSQIPFKLSINLSITKSEFTGVSLNKKKKKRSKVPSFLYTFRSFSNVEGYFNLKALFYCCSIFGLRIAAQWAEATAVIMLYYITAVV